MAFIRAGHITGQVTPHEPTEACGDRHCYWHAVDETWTPYCFRRCFECGHVYPTPEGLLHTFNAEALKAHLQDMEYDAIGLPKDAYVPVRDAAKITFCPYCSHDW